MNLHSIVPMWRKAWLLEYISAVYEAVLGNQILRKCTVRMYLIHLLAYNDSL
jgi:hypothetical protein